MERLVRRHRQRERIEPPVPRTAEFEIPDEYKTMDDGSQFVLHDSSVDNLENVPIDGRIIILGSRQTLEMLADARNIGGDGSFSRAPPGFMQFYSIHANVGQTYKVCVVILMTQRTVRNYEYALRKLKELEPRFDPSKIVMDFEQATKTAFKNVFPEIEIDGCFFHLGSFLFF